MPGSADLGPVLARLRHRGPDDSGTWRSPDGAAHLGHTRLSVLDPTPAGHQPMVSPDGKTAIVYNGEVYNYPDLRKELQKTIRLVSSCDTEAILHLYLRDGLRFLQRLNGMFALAVYDSEAQRLILARDRAGQKPLYYTERGGRFAFASELQALQALGESDYQIDPCALVSYLQFDYVPTPGSIYRDVRKLPPGHLLVREQGRTRVEPFWELDPECRYDGDYDSASAEMDGLLDDAVRARLLSDVPLGVFLSGGLDSSAIASYAVRHHAGVETFSMAFEDPTYDESGYGRAVAERLGTDHHEWTATATDLLDAVQSGTMPMDEPLGDTSIVPTYLLSRATRQHVTVALGGDGGDELFAGYPTFEAEAAARFASWLPKGAWRSLEALLSDRVAASDQYLSRHFVASQFARGMQEPKMLRHQRWLGSFSGEEALSLLTDDLREEAGVEESDAGIRHWLQDAARWPPGTRLLYEYLRTYLMDAVLVKVDRASMAVSLEARSPMLDHRVLELGFSLPYTWKHRGFTGKRLLKDLMRDRLPDAVIDRPKKGFGMPIAQWLKKDLREWAREELLRLDEIGVQSAPAVAMLNRHARGEGDYRKRLWNLLALAGWVRQVHSR